MALEHSTVQRLKRKRILSAWEREVNSGAKSTAQAGRKKTHGHGQKWKIAEGRQAG